MKKIVALMLSVMMLFACIGSSEVDTIQAQFTVMGQEMLNAILSAGSDEDGCQAVKISGTIQGMPIEALLEVAAEAITVALNGEAYTITSDVIRQAEEALKGPASEQEAAVSEYINSGALMQDAEVIAQAAMTELNRAMNIAMQLGIVTITAEGNLFVYADMNNVVALAAQYLSEVAAEPSSINALASTAIWAMLELPDAATMQEIAAAYAEVLASADMSAIGAEAYLSVNVYAAGTFDVSIDAAMAETAANISASFDGENFMASCGVTENGANKGIVITASSTYIDVFAMIGDEQYGASCGIAENGAIVFECTAVNDEIMLLGSYSINAETGEQNCFVNVNGEVIAVTGRMTATETGWNYSIEGMRNGETVDVIDHGYVMTEDGLCLYFNMNGQEYAVVLTPVYTANGVECTGMLSVNGEAVAAVTAGYAMTEEGGVTVYVNMGEETYVITAAPFAAGYAVDVTVQAGDEAMSLASLVLSALNPEVIEHIQGYMLSADELYAIMDSIMG